MANSNRSIGAGYGRVKSENAALKRTVESLKFENAMLKNHNKQLFKQVYNDEINLKGRGTVTVNKF